MKTLKPVDPATYERIGAAYVVCAEYPEIFGDVPLKKFCGMFVDVLDEEEDDHVLRMRKSAKKMYRLLNAAYESLALAGSDEPLRLEIDELLSHIEGEPCPTDEGCGNE